LTRAEENCEHAAGINDPGYNQQSALVLFDGSWLTSFGFGAFFERGFTRKFHAAFVVDPDALDPNDVANFGNVFGSLDPEIRELGNVHEPIPAWENLDKRTEFLRRDDTALIHLDALPISRVMPPIISFARAMLSPLVA